MDHWQSNKRNTLLAHNTINRNVSGKTISIVVEDEVGKIKSQHQHLTKLNYITKFIYRPVVRKYANPQQF